MAEEISDVFISYAHADDEPPFGLTFGWVTIFVDELKKRLRSKLGGSGARIWMDYQLAANDKVTDALMNAISQSRTIVLFMSNGYARSEWCQKELGAFLDNNSSHKHKESVFIVELYPTNRENWHPRLQELTPIQFWRKDLDEVPQLLGMPVPKPDQDDLYWRNLNKLSHLVANHLEIVKETESAPKKDQVTLNTQSIIVSSINPQTSLIVSSNSYSKPTLWIAEPTEDLIDQWEALAEAVKQAGYDYRPSGLETYPRSSEADFLSKLRSDLGGAHLFVQLLGQTSGRRSKESNISFTALQNAAAVEFAKQQINFLQWRSRDIKLENVVDDTYRQLLTGAIACGFEEFRQRVLTTLQNLNSDSTTSKNPNTFDGSLAICISADVADRDLGHRISDILVELGADALTAPTPTQDQASSVFNAQLDEVICGSEGVIIVYGQSHPLWVQAQYNHARKALLAQKRKGIWGALLNGPPHDKSDAGVASKNLMMLDCRDGPERQHIEQFVNALRETSHA